MSVPTRTYATSPLRQLLRLALVLVLAAGPVFARGPGPSVRISLDSLDFQPQSPQFLLAGNSMLTLHYVDNNHLLFTFGVHRLMERIANDPPDDEDRMVEAVLVELPSGRVLARTDWRLHDSGQYLWNLGHGRFLLRIHDTLTTFAPLANLASGRPFQQRSLLMTDRKIGVLLLSPESDLLIVESAAKKPRTPDPVTPLFGPTPKPSEAEQDDPGSIALTFYWLSLPGSGDQVRVALAGVARANHFGDLAAMSAGTLGTVDEGRQHWGFDFKPFKGKAKELAPFDSTCHPRPQFVSSSEFVAFGCHNTDSPTVLGGFNLNGDEMWEQNLYGDYVASSMSFAPQSGRFALGRVLGEGSADGLQQIAGGALTGQTVTVYQTESGKQLLHIDCSPIARAGENFALSPDGMSLAVIRENALEVYSLPPLSKKDQADVKEARALIPRETLLPIEFAGPAPEPVAPTPAATLSPAAKPAAPVSSAAVASPVAAPPNAPSNAPKTAAPTTASAPTAAAAPPQPPPPKPAASSVPAGDAPPEQHRKPPTLYTLPGDHPGDSGDQGAK